MGKLIYLMGPSGAGKDTLLSALRLLNDPKLKIAPRFITRPIHENDAEQHIGLTEPKFLSYMKNGQFTMSWQAHSLWYGIGTEINQWLKEGINVVVNGSREYLEVAQKIYPLILQPVCLQLDENTQLQRLKKRNRESSAGIQQRLNRSRILQSQLPANCIFINSHQKLDKMVSEFKMMLDKL